MNPHHATDSLELLNAIPSLDLANFTSGTAAEKAQFVKDLGEAFNNIGFIALKNHGLSDEDREKLYAHTQAYFQQADKTKAVDEIAGMAGQRGYTGKGKEHAKGRTTGDLKEFYHVGQELAANDPDATSGEYPANVWPKDLPEFKEISLKAFYTLEAAGKQLLKAIALYLELPEDYFEDKVRNGNSILRAIHYYPIENPDEVPADAVRAAAHGDINLITLLMGASAEGLQVLRRDIHRVVNPPRELMGNSRYSIPFFMHPRSEMDLTCLESCINEEHPKRYTDMTAGEFLTERLIELGLLTK
jgi:isopenicillin N synthase-like dioxygenase